MSTELELKFALPEAFLSQLISLLPQLGETVAADSASLLNAYFDTTERWFRRHDMGLRSRQKRGNFEQTLKLAGRQHGAMQLRPEYNLPCSSVTPQLSAFDSSVWPEGTDVARLQQQLTELFRTDFQRHSWLLQCEDGSQIELVYDSGEVRAAEQHEAIAELELEFVSGNPGQLFVLARQLISVLPLRSGYLSKAARGYMLAAGSVVSLTQNSANTLAAQLKVLQQAEVVYDRAGGGTALAAAADAMLQLHVLLLEQDQHQAAASAAALAQQLVQQRYVFDLPDYNLLLLQLTQLLYLQMQE
ncbi:MAG: CYTH domain-containing protein [Gammaproteobacteria bacterium]|nr:CYTH domain-containing protein [Gammaproteobacteria bacterium]MBU1553242.1 CYTH domain-containing protein [Gammaproteobacteria bacterium]MBU2069019.1 CYTH domain-containing protein [Gammaproteobacteria bacterium]MBU2183242.1 CYTH domain-containing protein [Gammaproteobacteria bacterium]MBU2204621.1 CYTH domain-containing protein [Gammaproteobacteria bacterium]